ncbi:dimethyl sulfoxide reductase anchor subunit [Xenorhabdus sp. XENO-7]|uniref:Dimethyl sulfoxide reductase anchor subunit n=1 Tax=Xenorhabdus aichiensis TaxID=3025874 RepID=A0ABT5LZJ3_9GAMM|nr:DmsC/YnfH family molybdoenzyme membrane anchor subunit [Xenorhabdus aichiensis]MDC9620158.1 dimethyl sulfoxide reductase anchor subunit [Xenorhabdus aichiensis]
MDWIGMGEWLLIAFTMIVQSSIGLVLMSALYIYRVRHKLDTWQYPIIGLVQRILLVSSVLAGVGLASSLDLLGYPFSAYHSLRNVMREWINIEKTFAAIYFSLLSLYTLFVIITKRAHVYIIAGLGIIGLTDMHYMASIYVNSTMAKGININTYFLFYGAVFTLGPALALSFVGWPLKKRICRKLSTKLMMVALIIVFISVTTRLIEQPAYMEWLTEATTVDENIIFPLQLELNFKSAFWLRMVSWCLYIIAMAIWAYSLWKGRNRALIRPGFPILSGTVIMFIAEMVNQYTFFIICNM